MLTSSRVTSTYYRVEGVLGQFIGRVLHTTEQDALVHARIAWGMAAKYTPILYEEALRSVLPAADINVLPSP